MFILVDEMRFPSVFPAGVSTPAELCRSMPNVFLPMAARVEVRELLQLRECLDHDFRQRDVKLGLPDFRDLTVASAVHIILSGGALPGNIVWQVAGRATLGTTSHFEGILLSKTAITFLTGGR